MIPITPQLLQTFEPYRSVFSMGDVVVQNVWTVGNAYDILVKMGLPVSKKVIVNRFKTSEYHCTDIGWEPVFFLASYDFLQIGTENNLMKNNIATLNMTSHALTIYFHNEKINIGREHGLKVSEWYNVA